MTLFCANPRYNIQEWNVVMSVFTLKYFRKEGEERKYGKFMIFSNSHNWDTAKSLRRLEPSQAWEWGVGATTSGNGDKTWSWGPQRWSHAVCCQGRKVGKSSRSPNRCLLPLSACSSQRPKHTDCSPAGEPEPVYLPGRQHPLGCAGTAYQLRPRGLSAQMPFPHWAPIRMMGMTKMYWSAGLPFCSKGLGSDWGHQLAEMVVSLFGQKRHNKPNDKRECNVWARLYAGNGKVFRTGHWDGANAKIRTQGPSSNKEGPGSKSEERLWHEAATVMANTLHAGHCAKHFASCLSLHSPGAEPESRIPGQAVHLENGGKCWSQSGEMRPRRESYQYRVWWSQLPTGTCGFIAKSYTRKRVEHTQTDPIGGGGPGNQDIYTPTPPAGGAGQLQGGHSPALLAPKCFQVKGGRADTDIQSLPLLRKGSLPHIHWHV